MAKVHTRTLISKARKDVVLGYVGSFGCSGLNRVVLFRSARRLAYNRPVILKCPCGYVHRVNKPEWRPLREGEEVDVVVHEAD